MSCNKVYVDFVANDTKDLLAFTYQDQDLSGWADPILRIEYDDGLEKSITGIINNPSAGEFYFEFAVGDLKEGKQRAQVKLWDASNKRETWDGIILNIAKDFL